MKKTKKQPKQRKVLYPEVMRGPYKAPTSEIRRTRKSVVDAIHIVVDSASEILDAEGNKGWAIKGSRKYDISNPKYTQFVALLGDIKIHGHWVNVYQWRNRLWVRGTHGSGYDPSYPTAIYQNRRWHCTNGGRKPADRHDSALVCKSTGRKARFSEPPEVYDPTTISGYSLDDYEWRYDMVATVLLPLRRKK